MTTKKPKPNSKHEEFNSSLDAKIMQLDPEIRQFIVALKAENFALTKKIAKYQAHQVSLESEIATLKSQKFHDGPLSIADIVNGMNSEEKETVKILAASARRQIAESQSIQ